jgi:hypothetical protein
MTNQYVKYENFVINSSNIISGHHVEGGAKIIKVKANYSKNQQNFNISP